MSGGGKTVCRGRMGSSIASEVDPKELNNMENSLEKVCTCHSVNIQWEMPIIKGSKIKDWYFLFDLGHSRCSTKQGQQRETGGCDPAEPEGLVLYEAQAAEMWNGDHSKS